MVGWIILIAVLALILVLIVRAVGFKPEAASNNGAEPVSVDGQHALESLQAMVRFPTISRWAPEKADEAVFENFRAYLKQRYPLAHSHCPQERIGQSGIVFHWKGRSSESPTVLMAHYDVVPADDADAWKYPPFSGSLEGDVLWGRGTIDTKCTLCGILEAVEAQLSKGYVPQKDIFLSFSGDEEVFGTSAPAIVKWLKEKGISPALVVDEGGAVVNNIFPGVKEACALIGVGEKGMANIEISWEGHGGHASTPSRVTPMGRLAKAITQIEAHPFKANLPGPTVEMMETLGRYSGFGLKIIFANLWLFKGLISRLFSKAGGELGAMCHTTIAFTQASGSSAVNVIPTRVSAVANLRLGRDTTMEQAVAHFQKTAGESIKVKLLSGMNASPYADTSSDAWKRVKLAAGQTYPEAVVSPYIMMACSDSRNFCAICDNVLRFSPIALTKAQLGLIHGRDERLSKQQLEKCVEFFVRLIINS